MVKTIFKKSTYLSFKGVFFITVSILVLSSCGGSSSSSVKTVIMDGVFKDSNVSGLAYISADESGITNKNGQFSYEEGKNVAFSIGKLELGSGLGQPIMTPLDLVNNGSLKSAKVINKVRFLMMLDKDNKPSNGIEISSEVQEKAENWGQIDFTSLGFPTENVHSIITEASVADMTVHVLPDAETATTHLKTTLFCANAGAFVGSYSGSESGNIVLAINPITGEVFGSSFNSDNEVSVEVKSTKALDYDEGLAFTSKEDSAKEFSGLLSSVNELRGTWVDSTNNLNSGSFTGTRHGGEADAVYRYTVAFAGTDKGIFTFDVDKNKDVTGVVYSVSTKKETELSGEISGNKLTVTTEDGNEITGFIVEDTLAISGVWIKGIENGNFAGGGCKLN